MTLRTTLAAVLALTGLVACNVDSDGDGVAAHLDCDDTNAAIGPEAPELCDGLDNNCDGLIDNDTTDAPTFYADADRDGFGDPDVTTTDCEYDEATGGPNPEFEPYGYVTNADDCDDALATVHPDAEERCDTIDNDCDSEIDEDDAVDKSTWYADVDGDDFGDAAASVEACDQPTGYVANGEDCDDAEEDANPGADELCDGFDNDCDEEIDEDEALDAMSWFQDADGDGYGNEDVGIFACAEPEGYVGDNNDCNDEAATAFPGGTEVCDGLDNDCDSTTSEAGTLSLNATTDPYSTINEAANAAVDGDTIYVCAGTWAEDIYLSRAVNLVGGGGAEAVTIEGSGEDSVITYGSEGGDVAVTGLTITGGSGEWGGGLDAASLDSIVVTDVTFVDNYAVYGGGMMATEDGTTTLEDCRFEDNVALLGGGAFVTLGGEVDMSNVRMLDNEAQFGGALAGEGMIISMENTRLVSNYASDFGGGAALWEGELSGGQILNNLVDGPGGGMFLGEMILDGTEIKGNRSTSEGGGIYVDGDLAMLDTVVDNNTAYDGGGIVADGGTLTAETSSFSGNSAAGRGGGLYLNDIAAELISCDIKSNTADQGGGAALQLSTLVSTTSNWGTEGDGDENSPNDLEFESGMTYDAYGSSETFTCDADGNCI